MFPTASARHIQRAEEATPNAVKAYFNLAATQAAGHTGLKRTGNLIAKAYVLQLDVVAVVDVADVDLQSIANALHFLLLGLHAL